MQDNSKYNFQWGNGLVDFNSLSPNGKYFYQIREPEDMYWGLFVAKISFLDVNNNIVFHKELSYAEPLGSSDSHFHYSSFSENDEFAYYLERIDLNSLNHILIDLKNARYKSREWVEESKRHFSRCEKNNFKEEELELFKHVEWQSSPIGNRKERNLLFSKIWFPKI